MIKRKFIKVTLRQGESLSREYFDDRACVLVLKGCVMVFNQQGKLVFRLEAGDANIFDGPHDFTGTAVTDGTELVIV